MPAGLALPAEPGPVADGRIWRRRFTAVFNWTTVALTFYVALLFVLTFALPAWYGMGTEEWLFFLAYIVRQYLFSAILVLFALAAMEATLPPQMNGWLRAGLVFAGVVAAVSVSALIRLYFGRGPAMDSSAALRWYGYVLSLWTVAGMMGYGVIRAWRSDAEMQQRICDARLEHETLAAAAVEARLSALQAQIEPHFLFNTLANVKRLYETDAGRARHMLGSLIDYLRAALPTMRQAGSTVAREIELARAYLTILQMRMNERLHFAIDVDPTLNERPLPPLVLATLVENAIKHGIAALPEGGRIDIRVFAAGDQIVVQVADTGQGFVSSSGSGVGLANTRSRLAALYGERARLTLSANQPRGVTAEVRVPQQMPDPRTLEPAAVPA